MENLEIYENFSSEKEIEFTSRQRRKIIVKVQGGRIKDIDNQSGVRFPFHVGQQINRSIETWACNNNFQMDGNDPCPEKKVFGIKAKDIPKGHELRKIYPSKFR